METPNERYLDRQAGQLARIVLDQERSMQAAMILLERPRRRVPGTRHTTQADLARHVLRKALAPTAPPGPSD